LPVVALAALSLTPVTASASTTSVTPLLDCVARNSDGSYTAVIGYTSTHASTTAIPLGSGNYVTPSRYDGAQPTTFESGTHHGVFSLTVSTVDNTDVTWHVDGGTLSYSGKGPMSSSCPAPTPLPADGNGTGPVIALLVAGLVGVLVAVRLRRRAAAELSVPEVASEAAAAPAERHTGA
jgi:hypothetical protein